MNKHLFFTIVFGCAILLFENTCISQDYSAIFTENTEILYPQPKKSNNLPQPEKIIVKEDRPKWTQYLPLKKADESLNKYLADIECHLLDLATYKEKDLVTSAHECTHGINSNIARGIPNSYGFYLFLNKAIIFKEPQTKISKVVVPNSLKGNVYKLYLVDQRKYWENEPLYILNEWVSYTNGSTVGVDLSRKGKWNSGKRSDTILYMLEFNIYSFCLMQNIDKLDYSDKAEFKRFVKWQTERQMLVYNASKSLSDFTSPSHEQYLDKFRTNKDAEELRNFVKKEFGSDWCNKNFGF